MTDPEKVRKLAEIHRTAPWQYERDRALVDLLNEFTVDNTLTFGQGNPPFPFAYDMQVSGPERVVFKTEFGTVYTSKDAPWTPRMTREKEQREIEAHAEFIRLENAKRLEAAESLVARWHENDRKEKEGD